MIALLPVAAWKAQDIATFPAGLAIGLYVTFFTHVPVPKIAGLARRHADARRRRALRRLAALSSPSAAIELVFSFLQGAVSTIRIVDLHDRPAVRQVGGLGRAVARRAGPFLGRRRARTCGRIRCSASSSAARLAALAPAVFWWSLPLTAGYLLAIPFAVLTASEDAAELLKRHALCGIPEEFEPPAEIRALQGLSVALAPGTAAAVRRSLEIYYRDPVRDAAMDALYARFVKAGDLAFDIGAHVGDRIASFRRLGARVVALEPQPGPARAIRPIHGRDPAVILLQAAAGATAGHADAPRQHRQPDGLDRLAGFRPRRRRRRRLGGPGLGRRHQRAVPDPRPPDCTTTAARPSLKIDVEGFEDRVLVGLSQARPGAVLRVHDHRARRGAALPRSASRARPLPVRCRARRGAKAHLRPLGFAGRDGGAPRRPSP